MAARWPGRPGSPERKAAYAEDRARRAERARERFPQASPAERRAIVAGHAERTAQIPPSVLRGLQRAPASHLVTYPTAAGDRLVVSYRTAGGRWRTAYLPPGMTKEQFEAQLAPLGITPPTETP